MNITINLFQNAWGPSLTRQNSLTAASHNSGNITRYNNSPTMMRSCDHARRKPNNLSQDKPMSTAVIVPESPLPKIHEVATGDNSQEQNSSCSDEHSKTILRQIFSALEPKGYVRGRDDYSLYIFPPKNTYVSSQIIPNHLFYISSIVLGCSANG